MCVRVLANWLKRGVAMGVAYCKKAGGLRMDSWTYTRFTAKVCYEPKYSSLTVSTNWQKRGRGL